MLLSGASHSATQPERGVFGCKNFGGSLFGTNHGERKPVPACSDCPCGHPVCPCQAATAREEECWQSSQSDWPHQSAVYERLASFLKQRGSSSPVCFFLDVRDEMNLFHGSSLNMGNLVPNSEAAQVFACTVALSLLLCGLALRMSKIRPRFVRRVDGHLPHPVAF